MIIQLCKDLYYYIEYRITFLLKSIILSINLIIFALEISDVWQNN